jgi:hypothetical protein
MRAFCRSRSTLAMASLAASSADYSGLAVAGWRASRRRSMQILPLSGCTRKDENIPGDLPASKPRSHSVCRNPLDQSRVWQRLAFFLGALLRAGRRNNRHGVQRSRHDIACWRPRRVCNIEQLFEPRSGYSAPSLNKQANRGHGLATVRHSTLTTCSHSGWAQPMGPAFFLAGEHPTVHCSSPLATNQ